MKRFTKLTILAILCLPVALSVVAQDTEQSNKPKVEFSGFFRFDYWLDTYKNAEALDGLFLLYPLAPSYDLNGNDINAVPALNGLAMGTRLRTNITMPKIFNAKSSILVEADFTGMSSMVHFRFRHGFAKLAWENGSELNVGLTWHPMFVAEVFPYVASLNTGAPFQSFNRSPQITFKQQFGSSFKVILSALTQSDYKNYGPEGTTTQYLRNGIIPNLHGQIQLNLSTITAGAAIDFKSLMPRTLTVSSINPNNTFVTSERVNSLSGMVYLKLQTGLLTAKLKGMYGQNLADHLMLGGYAVSTFNPVDGHETYVPFNHLFGQVNVTYGKKFMPGIFAGYAKNLGTNGEVHNDVTKLYGRGLNIDYLYRVSPNFTYRNERLAIMGEVEYTFASTGTNNLFDKAKVINTESSANARFLIMIQYDF